jgi:tetratricopeptide (TPR) repeat protein
MAIDAARAKSLFLAASDLADPAERAVFLDRECGGDAALRARVEALLRANDAAPPPVAGGATVDSPVGQPQTVDHADPTARVGAILAGKYKLIEEIGAGGMGSVFMALQTEPVKRAVAVKVIKAGMDSKEVLARFEAERQALAMMDHPHIARVLDAGTTDGGRPFFVMELVKGTPITRYCDENKLTPRQRLELFVPVCQAIQHAHQKGIIHRDIKPSNVLVAMYDDRAVPKVIDFGLAKAAGQSLTEKTLMTGFGALVGTPEYMSPEQASLNNLTIDTRSDVYSLGVLLYELLTGTTPVDRKTLGKAALLEVLRIVREVEAPRPSAKLSSLGTLPSVAANRGTDPARLSRLMRGELDWLVLKALEKDRARRYDTPNALGRDIQRYLADEVVEARPPSVAYRLSKFVRRHRGQILVASLVMLALMLGGAGYWYVQHERDARQAQRLRDVNEAMHAARTLRARGQLERAREEAHRALTLVESGPADAALVDRVTRLKAELDREKNERDEKTNRQLAVGHYNRGLNLVRRGQWDEAIACFKKAVELDPKYASAHDELGYALSQKGQWDEAIACYKQAIKLDPKDAMAHANLGVGLHRKGQWDEAIACFKKAVKLDPKNAMAHANLGVALKNKGRMLHGKGQVDEAIACFKEAITLDPRDSKAHNGLGVALAGKGQTDEAIACYKKAIALDPNNARVHSNLGAGLLTKGQVDEAIACHKKAIALDPKLADAHSNLGAALAAKGQGDEAIACYKKALEIDPKHVKAHLGLGLGLTAKGQFDEAIAYCKKAVALDPKDASAHHSIGVALKGKGQRDEAVASFKMALALDPKNALTHYSLGVALNGKGQGDEAIACYKKAIALDPKLALAHANLGIELAAKGHVDEAIPCLKKALELDPKNVPAHNGLGLALARKGQWDEAIASYKKAIALDPKLVKAHINLGAALYGKGQVEEAIACFRKAVELDPKDAQAHGDLGAALSKKGQLDEAITCYKKAIALHPKYALAHFNLGNAIYGKGQVDEAIASWRKAIALDPKLALAHSNLGNALYGKSQVDEAIACWRKAIELNPKDTRAHNNLALALANKGKVDEAIACYKKAIALDPKNAQAHHGLGLALAYKGQVDEAIACYKKAIAFDPKNATARNNLAEAERLAAARNKLPAFQNGSYTPTSNDERLALAEWCRIKKLHHTATRLYAAAFAADGKLADDLRAGHRYNAACFVALAAAGQGEDAAKLDGKERTRLRQQARDWLRADLVLRGKQRESGKAADRAAVQQALRHWQQDTDLAGIRDAAALAKLPAEERAACEKLWADVAALLKQTER